MLIPPTAPLVASAWAATTLMLSSSPTANYLPRILYPGTYGNYCGPTPEVTCPDCKPNGWRGAEPLDRVDAACARHDVDYCGCENAWRERRTARGLEADGSLLSVFVALRGFEWPRTFLQARGIDDAYLQCVSRADAALLDKGISIRSEEQRSNCASSGSLTWFCDKNKDTLLRFERVNLAIFLKALDSDRRNADNDQQQVQQQMQTQQQVQTQVQTQQQPPPSLEMLEGRRRRALKLADARGEPLAAAVSSPAAVEAEEGLLSLLLSAGRKSQ